jgi:Ca-activated chloride channel family protein
MNDFHFANPGILLALPALVLLRFVLARLDRNARGKLLRFLDEANLRNLLQDRGTVKERGKRLAYWLGLACLTVALARPQANPTIEELTSSGLDIYVLLDVSRSMDCEDVAPSRLKKAKRSIQHLTSRLVGDRVGIIAFANSAVLVSPLTNDYTILDTYLQNIDTNVVPSQGTNFSNALETAHEAMARGAKNAVASAVHSNIFLMLSDGEDHAETDFSIVDTIKKEGGLVFTIAFGTEKGAPIPVRDDHGELKGYKKDTAGNVVVTKVEPKTLEEIARRGGGQFYHSTVDEGEIDDVLARVNNAQRGSYTTIKTTLWEEEFWLFLVPGLLLLLISFVPLRALVPGFAQLRGAVSRLRRPGTTAVAILVLLSPNRARANPLSFFWNRDRKASEQSAGLAKSGKFSDAVDVLKGLQAENPDNPEVNYDIGTYLLADKKGDPGREQLGRLRGADGMIRDRALFNIAGSLATEGKKEEARAVYAELLQRLQHGSALSNDEQALLAVTKRNVARLADPSQAPKPEPKQQDQKEQKDQKDQNQGGESQDKQQNGGPNGKDQKDQKKPDQGDKNQDQSGDKDKKDEGKEKEKKDGQGDEKKDEKKDGEKDKKEGPQQGQDKQGQGTRPGTQPFRERDDMGESEAKRILGALKERESDLQKKLMKNQVKGGRVNVDDAGKDW